MSAFVCNLLLMLSSVVASGDTKTRDCDVGELNKRAIYMPIPHAPRILRKIGGIVKVRVRINRKGEVVRTQAISGPQQLRAHALANARGARFDPSIATCESSKFVTGTLVYTYVRQGKSLGGKT